MFRRIKSAGDEPVANELRITAQPNVLNVGKSGKPNTSDWAWTADGLTADTETEDDEVETEDGLDEEQVGDEADDRTPEQRRADLAAELQRQAEEFGLTGDDSKALYGPNGDDVVAVLDALDEMDTSTAERLADAWEMADPAEREIVERVVGRRHRDGKRHFELRAAEDAVAAWLAAQKSAGDDLGKLWHEVAQAARNAVIAIILDEDLSDADYDTLYGPWSDAIDEEDDEADGEAVAQTSEESAGSAEEAGDAAQEGPFGPNSELVIKFLGRLGTLDRSLTAALVAAWREQPKEELKAAHRAMQSLADEDAAWREQLRLAQEEIFAWMERRTTTIFDYSLGPKDDTRARESAGPAVADAIAALVLADILEPEEAETLYAPWAEVVSEPELPTYEDDDSDRG